MVYQSLTQLMLISAPADLPDRHLSLIRKTINQWNLNYGRLMSTTVLPVSWSENAVPEFGNRPQALLNGQIVDGADSALAIFSDRLGTPTGEAESGTDEEITKLAEAGKSVFVLRNNCERPVTRGVSAAKEKERLESYLEKLEGKALILSYADEAELIQHVNAMLSRFTSMHQQSIEDDRSATERTAASAGRGVWPRAEVTERAESDSKGRLKTKRRWDLVLHNMTGGPAHDVTFEFEGEGLGLPIGDGDLPIATMPVDGEFRFPVIMTMESPRQAECVVKWTDGAGEQQMTRATVRA